MRRETDRDVTAALDDAIAGLESCLIKYNQAMRPYASAETRLDKLVNHDRRMKNVKQTN